MDERPRCSVPGCDKPAQHKGQYNKNGDPYFAKMCGDHLSDSIAAKHGLNHISEVIAKKAGFNSVAEYNNSRHRYRYNRKDYCQNSVGEAVWVDPDTGEHKPLHEHPRVGTCTASIIDLAMLSVDHINGNNLDDRPENHQTLCHNCHKIKGLLSKDHWSCEKKREHLDRMLKSSASHLIFG